MQFGVLQATMMLRRHLWTCRNSWRNLQGSRVLRCCWTFVLVPWDTFIIHRGHLIHGRTGITKPRTGYQSLTLVSKPNWDIHDLTWISKLGGFMGQTWLCIIFLGCLAMACGSWVLGDVSVPPRPVEYRPQSEIGRWFWALQWIRPHVPIELVKNGHAKQETQHTHTRIRGQY